MPRLFTEVDLLFLRLVQQLIDWTAFIECILYTPRLKTALARECKSHTDVAYAVSNVQSTGVDSSQYFPSLAMYKWVNTLRRELSRMSFKMWNNLKNFKDGSYLVTTVNLFQKNPKPQCLTIQHR